MPRLVVQRPGGLPSSVTLDREIRIGRDADMDLVLADAAVSRHHATLVYERGTWLVIDADSRHGTHLNGVRVTREELKAGDQVQIGGTFLRFETQAEPTAVAVVTTQALPTKDERLRIFYRLAEATAAIDDSDAALQRALEAIVAVLGCERGVIALGTKQNDLRRAAEVQGRGLVIARAVIDAVLARGEGILLRSGELMANTLDAQGVRSALAAPLRIGDRNIGLVYLDDRGRSDRFEPVELELLVAVARLAAVIVDVASRYERAVALVELAEQDRVAPQLIGRSEALGEVRRALERFAPTELPVHLTGEKGVGKELVARAVHELSPRRAQAFVAVNCAAIPDTLLESELFGHVRGAFTGADKTRRGKLSLADRGTLFLDEVVDLSMAAQAKLLRVLEDGEVTAVGAEQATRVDLRIVSASHIRLLKAVEGGRFRQDLYYRLLGAEIAIPALRERGQDVVELAHAFLARVGAKRAAPVRFSTDALAAMTSYRWPGNVRELQHAIERACAIASGDIIESTDLALPAGDASPTAATSARGPQSLAVQFAALETTERRLVEEALARAAGNVSEAARLLGITRIMMKRRIGRFIGGDDNT
jgi:Nif-specific regulatory protein